ncbi:M50 family metallopeptidase [Rhodococcus sp. G-MC3]|uniref:M50 family metallopeptidase n=1 Tax=Rhodococcus sp. G-MC3 TaxID=3046209 RepID=UPI0024BAB821|nr:M50 family metallopeptidase [Rhodococcus sp. G-MC3]MDJ0394636.1 M50 family metallopeptidase [Rhodococcus sp. G-MC3]
MSEFWDRISAVSPDPPVWIVQLTALIALAIVLIPQTWRIARNVVTIAHEGSHLFFALITGRQLMGLRLHHDTSGVAISKGKPTGLGVIVMTFAGYVGPSLLGLTYAFVLGTQHAIAVLWIGVISIALMMLMIRNLYGLLSLVLVGALLFAVSWWGTGEQQVAAAYFITFFLLIAGPRPVLELQRSRSGGRARDSDADQLARLTFLPGIVWVGLFLLVTLGSLAVGAWRILVPVQ